MQKHTMLKTVLSAIFILTLSGCATESIDTMKDKPAKEILKNGEKELNKNNYVEAQKYFEALDALYPFGPEAEQGQLDSIYAYYKNDDYSDAVSTADHYIHLYPSSNYVDYAYYMKGLSDFERGMSWFQKIYEKSPDKHDLSSMRAAFDSFNELLHAFPKSKYASDSWERMISIRNLFAKQEINVAKFYFQRKAYVAAANRASYVVNHYQGAPEVKEALSIMIDSYKALGAKEQLAKTEQVYKLNF
jgi:outer membrane protein assembly factor BamD